MFYLSQKNSGGLYTQEEFEVARVVCERLVDTQASIVLAQRLADLQRDRLVETQVADRQTRRVLHDEILPQLHAAILALPQETTKDTIAQFTRLHKEVSRLLREMPPPVQPSFARNGLVEALQKVAEVEFHGAFDDISCNLDPSAANYILEIPALAGEVLFYAAREVIRNAARYGRPEEGIFELVIRATWEKGLRLSIEDNGKGMESPGESKSGAGLGLQLHSTMLAVVGGTLSLESHIGGFTRVDLYLPEIVWSR